MKTLKDFTPEIQGRISDYKKRYLSGIEDGGRYNSFGIKNAEALIFWNYEKCGYKKPIVLVAENPYESQLYFNWIKAQEKLYLPIIYLLFSLKNRGNACLYSRCIKYNVYFFKNNTLYILLKGAVIRQLREFFRSSMVLFF